MERAAPLVFSLLCAAFFFGSAASASIFPPFLAHLGSPPGAASAAQAVKPLYWKGKTVIKYVAKMPPTKQNGKVVGDKGAWGRYVIKVVRYSATTYYATYDAFIMSIKSGGKEPYQGTGASCAGDVTQGGGQWTNITSDKNGRLKRYSFTSHLSFGPKSLAEMKTMIALGLKQAGGPYIKIGHEKNPHAICGKLKKVKG
ncbi:unnamed protein product [Closterium sp. Naga37s-1]|nr:unnamed protein product [Closterium sp. Naga37s-1]